MRWLKSQHWAASLQDKVRFIFLNRHGKIIIYVCFFKLLQYDRNSPPPLQSQNTPEAGGLLVMTIFNVSEGFRLSFFCHYVIKYIVQILLFRWALGGIFQEINLEKLKKATYIDGMMGDGWVMGDG